MTREREVNPELKLGLGEECTEKKLIVRSLPRKGSSRTSFIVVQDGMYSEEVK